MHPKLLISADELDERAREILDQMDQGTFGEQEARRQLMSLAFTSKVLHNAALSQARRWPKPHQWDEAYEFIKSEITEVLVVSITGGPGQARAHLDLDRIAGGASFSGYLGNFLSNTGGKVGLAGRKFQSWNRWNGEGRTEDGLRRMNFYDDDTALENAGSVMFTKEQGIPTAENVVPIDIVAKSLRGRVKVHRHATLLMNQYELPPLRHIPVKQRRRRETILAWLSEHDDSNDAVLDIVRALVNNDEIDLGPESMVADLFSHLEIAGLEAMEGQQDIVLRKLVEAAVTARPQPRKEVVVEMSRRVKGHFGGSERVAAKVCRAWAEAIAEVDGSEYRDISAPEKTDEQVDAGVAAFEAEVDRRVKAKFTGLGSDAVQVHAALTKVFVQVENDFATQAMHA